MNITKPDILTRNWGTESIVVWTPTHAGKILKRKAGTKGGFQCHLKEESHYIVSGSIRLEHIDGDELKTTIVNAGSAWTVPPMTFHREEALEDCILFEVSDPTRDDRYGLVPDPGSLPSMSTADARQKLIDLAKALESRAATCRILHLNLLEHSLDEYRPTDVAVVP